MRNIDYNAVLNTLATMRARGRPCPVLTIVGPDEISLANVKDVSPETVIVLRVYHPNDGDLRMSADEYFRQFVEPYAGRRLADYHQVNNEVNDFSPTAINWWMQQMVWAESRGYHLAVPSWSTGNPPDLATWQRADVLDMLRRVRDGKHVLALHEYDMGIGDWTMFRFLHHVYPGLPGDLRSNMPKVAFTEFGMQKARDLSADTWFGIMQGWQAELAKYPFVLGASLWSLGDTGAGAVEDWTMDNWANKLGMLARL